MAVGKKKNLVMKKQNIILFLIFIFAGISKSAFSQSGGKFHIKDQGFMSIFGQHSFTKGSGFISPGKITTSRNGAKGYLNFTKDSDWNGASSNRFVDGYVCVYHDKSFIFPVGHKNQYRPVAISGARKTTVGYYFVSPANFVEEESSLAQTGGNSNFNFEPVARVSNREFWDIGGDQPTKISLLWEEASNVANITNGKLENLTLLGFRNGQWEIIPSTIEQGTPDVFLQKHPGLTTTPSFNQGVISTNESIVPDSYRYITIGAKEDLVQADGRSKVFTSDLITVYPNPVVKDIYINLEKISDQTGTIKIYNLYGVQLLERLVDGQTDHLQHFDASDMQNGIYEIFVKMGDKVVSQKFVVGRLY